MFRRRPHPPSSGSRAEPESRAGPGAESHRSLAFPALLAGLPRGRKVTVLDLGPAVPENVEFFSRRACKLVIEDLRRGILGTLGGNALALGEVLIFPPDLAFDAVLAWDLFDYLDAETLKPLVERLRRHSRPGAQFFAMAGYLAEIPDRPMRFKIEDDATLLYGERSPHLRPSPRRAAREMSRLLEGFTMQTSYLLRHGWQEFLFVRDG